MKWQLISREKEETKVKHWKLLKLFGARFHNRPEINAWEFRFAYFTIGASHQAMTETKHIKIPIPFMKYDVFLQFRRYL